MGGISVVRSVRIGVLVIAGDAGALATAVGVPANGLTARAGSAVEIPGDDCVISGALEESRPGDLSGCTLRCSFARGAEIGSAALTGVTTLPPGMGSELPGAADELERCNGFVGIVTCGCTTVSAAPLLWSCSKRGCLPVTGCVAVWIATVGILVPVVRAIRSTPTPRLTTVPLPWIV